MSRELPFDDTFARHLRLDLPADLRARVAAFGALLEMLRGAGGRHVPMHLRAALAHLGLDWPCTEEDVRRARNARALVDHPDRGGSAEAFRKTIGAAETIRGFLATVARNSPARG